MAALQIQNRELRFASPAAHKPRRVLNAGSGLKSIERLGAVFDRSACPDLGNVRRQLGLQAVAAIVTTSVPLLVFLVFQRQFAGGALASSGSKE